MNWKLVSWWLEMWDIWYCFVVVLMVLLRRLVRKWLICFWGLRRRLSMDRWLRFLNWVSLFWCGLMGFMRWLIRMISNLVLKICYVLFFWKLVSFWVDLVVNLLWLWNIIKLMVLFRMICVLFVFVVRIFKLRLWVE